MSALVTYSSSDDNEDDIAEENKAHSLQKKSVTTDLPTLPGSFHDIYTGAYR